MDNRYSPATILAAMLVLSLPPCAAAQISTRMPAQRSATAAATAASVNQAQSSLNEAREALTTLPVAAEGALDDLRRDFRSLRSMFVGQNTGTGAAAASEGKATTQDTSKGTESSSPSPSQSSSSVTPRPSEEPVPTKAAHNAEAIGLLQRVHDLLGRYHSDDGRNLKLAGKVTMERADVDEMAAVVQELELMLQK